MQRGDNSTQVKLSTPSYRKIVDKRGHPITEVTMIEGITYYDYQFQMQSYIEVVDIRKREVVQVKEEHSFYIKITNPDTGELISENGKLRKPVEFVNRCHEITSKDDTTSIALTDKNYTGL